MLSHGTGPRLPTLGNQSIRLSNIQLDARSSLQGSPGKARRSVRVNSRNSLDAECCNDLLKIVHAFPPPEAGTFRIRAPTCRSNRQCPFALPIMKRFNHLEKPASAAGAEIHYQSAEDRLSHEGQPAPERAQNARPLGAGKALRAHPRGAQGAPKPTSFTTARPTPAAPFTWVRR